MSEVLLYHARVQEGVEITQNCSMDPWSSVGVFAVGGKLFSGRLYKFPVYGLSLHQ